MNGTALDIGNLASVDMCNLALVYMISDPCNMFSAELVFVKFPQLVIYIVMKITEWCLRCVQCLEQSEPLVL